MARGRHIASAITSRRAGGTSNTAKRRLSKRRNETAHGLSQLRAVLSAGKAKIGVQSVGHMNRRRHGPYRPNAGGRRYS